MNITQGLPPNIEDIKKVFPVTETTVFAYGDTLYVQKASGVVSEHLMAHEETHANQQQTMGNTPESWWDKYLKDKEFRLSQELAAYRNQYRFYCNQYTDRNKRAVFLHVLARDLSSELYGNIISMADALIKIKT